MDVQQDGICPSPVERLWEGLRISGGFAFIFGRSGGWVGCFVVRVMAATGMFIQKLSPLCNMVVYGWWEGGHGLDGVGCWMALGGVGWCSMVLDGVGWCWTVLDGVGWIA